MFFSTSLYFLYSFLLFISLWRASRSSNIPLTEPCIFTHKISGNTTVNLPSISLWAFQKIWNSFQKIWNWRQSLFPLSHSNPVHTIGWASACLRRERKCEGRYVYFHRFCVPCRFLILVPFHLRGTLPRSPLHPKQIFFPFEKKATLHLILEFWSRGGRKSFCKCLLRMFFPFMLLCCTFLCQLVFPHFH